MFVGLIKFLKDNGLMGNIRVVVPKIVFEELKKQQKDSYVGQLEKLRGTFAKFEDLMGFKLEIPEVDYAKHLDDKSIAFISKYGIIQLDYPDKLVFPKLITKVLNREKPFYKKQSDKDAGFKDALIWESILDYALKNKDQNVILFTRDPDFQDEKLLDEFKATTGTELKVIDKLSDMKAFIDETQKLDLYFAFIRNSFNQRFRDALCGVLRDNCFEIAVSGERFRILDFGIGNELLDMNLVDKDVYELSVVIRVLHETFYTGYGVVDEIYEPYEEEELSGVAVLSVEKTKENKILFKDIRFEGFELIGSEKIARIDLS